MIKYSCPKCGSHSVLQDACKDMNTEEVSLYDNKVCGNCSAEFNQAVETEVPDEPRAFTAFCRESSGEGTIWIDRVHAVSLDDAIKAAVKKCAQDWCREGDEQSIHVLGVAEGDVTILHWED